MVTLTTHNRTPATNYESLRAQNARLSGELAAARLVSANRLAAIRAALSAASDGEPDPLAYLRDQLADEHENAGAHRSGR
jgi:hypothetical protein